MPDCIFCSPNPCSCSTPRRAPRKAVQTEPKPIVSVSSRPKLSAGGSESINIQSALGLTGGSVEINVPDLPVGLNRELQDSDPEWDATVRALAPIADAEFRAANMHILARKPSLPEKIVAWVRLMAWRKEQRAKTSAK